MTAKTKAFSITLNAMPGTVVITMDAALAAIREGIIGAQIEGVEQIMYAPMTNIRIGTVTPID